MAFSPRRGSNIKAQGNALVITHIFITCHVTAPCFSTFGSPLWAFFTALPANRGGRTLMILLMIFLCDAQPHISPPLWAQGEVKKRGQETL